MEVNSGFPLMFQQLKALLQKNLLLSWRNRKATLLQLLSPLFFMFMIFIIDESVKAQYTENPRNKKLREPPFQPSPAIPPCEEKFGVKLPCYDFVWSGNEDIKFGTIASRIMQNNPGRPIPPSKVKSFRDKDAVDEWLLKNPMHCPGALHFMQKGTSIISYGVQTNSTQVFKKRGQAEDPTAKFQLPLQLAAEREIARFLIGDPNFSWNVFLKEFAHPALKPVSAVGLIGPTFFFAIAIFNFVLQISSLVTEKELKLRQAMNMMGLFDSAYWLSWLIWEIVITFLSSLLTVLFGMMFQFRFFLDNNFLVVFLVFFLFELSMTSFAFMLSAFIRKSSSATTAGFSIFIIGFLTQTIQILVGFPYDKDLSKHIQNTWSLFPPHLFAEAIKLLSTAVLTTEDGGVNWSKVAKCPPYKDNCAMTMLDIYIWFLRIFVLWFYLAIYFDNIIPNPAGVRKPVFYFLNPNYWLGKGDQKVKEGGVLSGCCKVSAMKEEPIMPDDEDVLEEETTVKQQLAESVVDANVAVQIRGLVKTYPGSKSCCCCCSKETKPYSAVKGLWVNFEKDQLFCLLGPNGAGKTTTISCLTGISPTTDGDALIYGHSIRSTIGMANIQKLIGVCPQFDILWDALTAEEHLRLFAIIKGLPPSSISPIIQKSLEEVKLTDKTTVRAGSYSGGMKRRLSVAIALIGDPKLVILDEPTTGMDPITRRHVWDIIENAKKGRSIVLTTHSMEEADILSDRIGIMAKGRLRCVGTSIRLKSRFGSGFIASVSFHGNNGDTVSTGHHEAVKEFFNNHLNVVPKEEIDNFLTFVIPHDRERLLTNFFAELEDRKDEYGISNIQLGLTTLEEVFLNIAKKAEIESAAIEGKLVTLTLTSGESAEIPIGAQFVGFPGTESKEYPTGFMVEVYWEQDDSAGLIIAGHSQKVQVPSGIELSSSPAAKHQRNMRWTGAVQGVVLDPSQVGLVRFQ